MGKIGNSLARYNGASFELLLQRTFELKGWYVKKLPTGGRIIGRGDSKKAILVKSPFDFIIGKNGVAIFCDAKSTTEVRFKFSSIDFNQVTALLPFESKGFMSGYFVFFSSEKKIVFYSAMQLYKVTPNTSLGLEDGVPLEAII